MTVPTISVLIPARDAARTLPAALRSVARQTFQDWECIVVDDGSTDATHEVATAWARSEPRGRVIRGEGRGIVRALNRGLDACCGHWVARMDADDYMSRRRLERQFEVASGQRLAGVGAHVRIFPRAGLREGRLRYERWLNSLRSPDDVARSAFIECPLAHPNWLLRRDLFDTHRYDDRGWPEDYDLLLRLLGDGHRLGVVRERLLHWRDHPGRLSRTAPAYALDAFTRCKAHYLARGPLEGRNEYILWGYGDTAKSLARALGEERKRPSAIVEVHPGRIGQKILGARVIGIAELPKRPALPMVVSVAGEQARGLIREALCGTQWKEGESFWFAA